MDGGAGNDHRELQRGLVSIYEREKRDAVGCITMVVIITNGWCWIIGTLSPGRDWRREDFSCWSRFLGMRSTGMRRSGGEEKGEW